MTTADESFEQGRPTIQTDESFFLPWLVCLAAALFFFYEFMQMNLFNAISPGLMQDFSMDAISLGYLSSTYLYANICFLLPAGLICDRYSIRKIVLISMTLCIGGTFGFAVSYTPFFAGFFHFVSGIGNAFCFVSCMLLAARWFPPQQRAFVIGIIITIAMAGGVVAQTPLALLSGSIGWRHAVLFDVVLGMAIMVVIWFFVHDYPADKKELVEKQQAEVRQKSFLLSIWQAMINAQNWLCGLYTCLLNLPIMVLGAIWGDLFLMQAHGFSITQATVATSMLYVGTIVGAPLGGWLSDRIALRRRPMIAGAILSTFIMFWLIYVPSMTYAMAILGFFALGLFTSTQVLSYPTITEANPPSITGTALALVSTIIMVGASIAQPLFGYLIQLHWDQTIIANIPTYSVADYSRGLLMIPLSFIVALFAALFVRETYCQPHNATLKGVSDVTL